jgi:hypothetical protein
MPSTTKPTDLLYDLVEAEEIWAAIAETKDRIRRREMPRLEGELQIGRMLLRLRQLDPTLKGQAAVAAASQHGVAKLTKQQIPAMIWLATLTPERLRELRARHTTSRSAESLQKEANAEDEAPAANVVKLPRGERAKAKREERQRETRQRKEARAARERAAADEDRRPRCTPQEVVMYGVRLWPVIDQERLQLGYYGFDALLHGVHIFMTTLADLNPLLDVPTRATMVKQRMKPWQLLVDRRTVGPSQRELLAVLNVVRVLCDLFAANPEGECQPPFDPCMRG